MDAVRIIIFVKTVIFVVFLNTTKKIKIKCLFLLPVNTARQAYDPQNWLSEYGKSFFFHTEINTSNENSYFEELVAILILLLLHFYVWHNTGMFSTVYNVM